MDNSDNALLQVGDVITKKAMAWTLTEVELPKTKGNKLLQFAASYGLTSVCESLLLRGYDINGTDSLGWTPLMQAVHGGHSDIVQLLIKSGGKVDVLNSHGIDAFALAAAIGNLQIMQILYGEKRTLEQNNNLRTALELCCINGHLTCVKWLAFTTSLDFNSPSVHNGQTPLMLAILGGHIEIVEFLLNIKCDLRVCNNFHQTAKDIAIFKNDSNMIELLRMYALKSTTLQLPFTSVKLSLSSRDETGYTGLPGKEITEKYNGIYTRICNNSEYSMNNSAVNKGKINCICKLSPENGTDRFANVYFQFPSISCSEKCSDQSSCSSHVLVSSTDSGQTLAGIISPRYFCGTCQKSLNSVKKRQFSAVTSCSSWFTKFVKRRSKSVNDSCYSNLNSTDKKLHNNKQIDFSHIFHELGLQEYWPIFKEKALDLASFLTLTEDDLETMGIKNEVDKCKILYAIEHLKRSPL